MSVRNENASKGFPTVPGFVMMINEETGFLEGIMDGTYLTAVIVLIRFEMRQVGSYGRQQEVELHQII